MNLELDPLQSALTDLPVTHVSIANLLIKFHTGKLPNSHKRIYIPHSYQQLCPSGHVGCISSRVGNSELIDLPLAHILILTVLNIFQTGTLPISQKIMYMPHSYQLLYASRYISYISSHASNSVLIGLSVTHVLM